MSVETAIDELARQMVEAGIPAPQNARASIRKKLVEFSARASSDPDKPMPLLIDIDEMARLNDIARNAALQAGAKGPELDRLMNMLFRQLAESAGRKASETMNRRETLHIVS
jgi:hypothetical protein